MRKLLVLLAMVLAFTLTSVAQYESSSTSTKSEQTTTTKSKSKQTESSDSKKEATMTGCLSAQPDADGNYRLSNDNYKKGVKVGPSDKVKAHAGHTVQLTGQWSGTGKEKEKRFEVASLKHIDTTCK